MFITTGEMQVLLFCIIGCLILIHRFPGLRTDMGAMYWKNENVSLAEQAFRETIARDPGFGHAYVNLGLLLQLARNNLTEARAVWLQLITLNPDHKYRARRVSY